MKKMTSMACLKSRKLEKGEIVFGHKSSLLNKVLARPQLVLDWPGRRPPPIVWQTPRNVDIFDKTEIGFFSFEAAGFAFAAKLFGSSFEAFLLHAITLTVFSVSS